MTEAIKASDQRKRDIEMLEKQKQSIFYKSSIAGALMMSVSLLSSAPATALTPPPENKPLPLVPHIAVYDLSIDKIQDQSNISGAYGRMVVEINGSKCEGHMVNMRFRLSVLNNKAGSNLTDVFSSSLEDGDAKFYRFNTTQYSNQKLTKTTVGEAKRTKEGQGIAIKTTKPKAVTTSFKGKTYLPTEHTKLIIEAAKKGIKTVSAPVYDGSENGDTLYDTTSFIGAPLKDDDFVTKAKIKNLKPLKGVQSWPVSVSFFEQKNGQKQDRTPDYEISFRLYENGVSRALNLDYGEFSLIGKLKNITFLKAAPCDQ